MAKLALVVDVKRYSFEDGPGIRSVVFFKGCPLRCIFCHNPESQDSKREIAFYRQLCIECGLCAKACTSGAVDLHHPERIRRQKCNRCGKCTEICPTDALRLIGKHYSVESLTELLLRDSEYYRYSGGGITLSGGECTRFSHFLEALLKSLKSFGIHVVLETSGHFNYTTFRRHIYPYLDLIYYDIKFVASETHRKYCGQSNTIILRNFRRLVEEGAVNIQPRTPLIPGITSTEENLSAIADFLGASGAPPSLALPYNPMGLTKWGTLGRPTPDLPASFMDPEEQRRACKLLKTNFLSGELVKSELRRRS